MHNHFNTNNPNYRHGGCIGEISPLYAVWQSMKGRCLCKTNRRYKDYGGRGITICDDWLVFGQFKDWAEQNGYRKRLTLDRIDTNGNYCPENCRWVDYKTQANNKRSNHIIEHNGERKTLAQWAEHIGISIGTLSSRLEKLHWPVELALSPLKNTKLKSRKK